MRRAGRASARHRAEHLATRAVGAVARALPEVAADRLGALLGWLLARVRRARWKVVTAQLRTAFPKADERWRLRVARRSYAHFGAEVVAWLRLGGASRAAVRERTRLIGAEILAEARERGRGAMLVSGHLGNWEVGTAGIVARGFAVDVVVARQRNPLFDSYLTGTRERLGMRVVLREDARAGVADALGGGAVRRHHGGPGREERGGLCRLLRATRLHSPGTGPPGAAVRGAPRDLPHGAEAGVAAALRCPHRPGASGRRFRGRWSARKGGCAHPGDSGGARRGGARTPRAVSLAPPEVGRRSRERSSPPHRTSACQANIPNPDSVPRQRRFNHDPHLHPLSGRARYDRRAPLEDPRGHARAGPRLPDPRPRRRVPRRNPGAAREVQLRAPPDDPRRRDPDRLRGRPRAAARGGLRGDRLPETRRGP